MKTRLLHLFKERLLSPLWVLLIDTALMAFAFNVAYIARLNFKFSTLTVNEITSSGVWVCCLYFVAFLIFQTYKGIIRHTELAELRRVLYTTFTAMLFAFLFNTFNKESGSSFVFVPRLVIMLHFLLSLFFLIGFRLMVREVYAYLMQDKRERKVFIYGAGELGMIALDTLRGASKDKYRVVGFIDDDERKWNNRLRDLPVYDLNTAIKKGKEKQVTTVVIAISDFPKKQLERVTEFCLEHNIEVKILPTFDHWINGKTAEKKIRDLSIEDLLGREQIQLDMERIHNGLSGKVVLVSGAAGSIGSEMVRQLVKFPLKKLLLLDQAESPLYDLQQELIASGVETPFELIIADISNYERMESMFRRNKPQVVINAAAYKHVPLMEENPYEALNVNVRGTKNLADLSVRFSVEKFVMVSTDKAVNPTNVMGASKRISEIYIQALAQVGNCKTSFVTTRFGNVLGSNGSVVPLFRKQIENGGPVTVTHPEITRYFMTIPEACQLVLEAGFMGKGGEIYLFDMGKPVKIVDLAKRMIELSGLTVGEDIEIKFTGLRPGEKLYEELLSNSENTKPTHNKKIKIGKVCKHDYEEINFQVEVLIRNLNSENNMDIVSRMKRLVPEYKSQNSTYEKLDQRVEQVPKQLKMFNGAAYRFPV